MDGENLVQNPDYMSQVSCAILLLKHYICVDVWNLYSVPEAKT